MTARDSEFSDHPDKPFIEKRKSSFFLPWLERRAQRPVRPRINSSSKETLLFNKTAKDRPVSVDRLYQMDEASIFDGFFDPQEQIFTFGRTSEGKTTHAARTQHGQRAQVAQNHYATHTESGAATDLNNQNRAGLQTALGPGEDLDIEIMDFGRPDLPGMDASRSGDGASQSARPDEDGLSPEELSMTIGPLQPNRVLEPPQGPAPETFSPDNPAYGLGAGEEDSPEDIEWETEPGTEALKNTNSVAGDLAQPVDDNALRLRNLQHGDQTSPEDDGGTGILTEAVPGGVPISFGGEAAGMSDDQDAPLPGQNRPPGDSAVGTTGEAPAAAESVAVPVLKPKIKTDELPDKPLNDEETRFLIESIKNDDNRSDHEKQIDIARIIGRHTSRDTAKPKKKKKGRYFIDPAMLSKSDSTVNISRYEIEQTRIRLEKTLADYKIKGHVVGVEIGPILTMYEVALAAGIKVSSVSAIQDEIRMNLEVISVRVVAPIPGRNTIGIEIPNKTRKMVRLGDILDTQQYVNGKNLGLPIALGQDIVGKDKFIDLRKLPHLLIAGATGSGKSVAVNSIILSMLFKFSPEEVRFLMIDPKVVELQLYNNIPHLLMPVVTDPKDSAKALAWAVMEMERRYVLLSALKTRDLVSYNEKVQRLKNDSLFPELEKMPYIIVMIDELGDLMMVAGKEVEGHIVRLTQKARAVGIHLVMATQRPSVDVITALIKANCPARIAFQVAQKTDSRTILDAGGAETLLGKGDLLYSSPATHQLLRFQAPFVSEEEVAQVVDEVKLYGAPNYVELNVEEEQSAGEDPEDKDEELFDEAWNVIKESGKASASFIQRRLRIGYNRAARIIELMEERGYIGPQIGSKPREILKSG